jgi:RHS repeat-associated protein
LYIVVKILLENQLHGFKGSGTGFTYDANGNMLNSSQAGGLLHYNHLNLPYKFQGGGTIEWLYDASGMKHQKKTTGGPPDENYTKDYILGIEYKDGQIESIMHPEGRAVWFDEPEDQEPGKFIYEYNLKDHLGNVRVVFADKNDNGFIHPYFHYGALGGWFGNNYQDAENHEIVQENHYYPFGMAMEGAWENVVPEVGQDYLYNGKEMQGDFGLDWDMAMFRSYDAAIGRFVQIDPLAEITPDWTPYRFGFDNPILYSDPDGLFETKDEAKAYAKANGIKTGWFRKNKINENSDGTFSIDNTKNRTSIYKEAALVDEVSGNDSVVTASLIMPHGIVEDNSSYFTIDERSRSGERDNNFSRPSLGGPPIGNVFITLTGKRRCDRSDSSRDNVCPLPYPPTSERSNVGRLECWHKTFDAHPRLTQRLIGHCHQSGNRAPARSYSRHIHRNPLNRFSDFF